MALQEKIYKYFEQYDDLHVLFVFDPSGEHQMELMGVVWPTNYIYEVYDGSAFTTKCKIHQEWQGKKVVLIIPGRKEPSDQMSRLDFPLLGEMMANMAFKEEGYLEFIQKYGLREELASYISSHLVDLNSAKVKAALEPYLNRDMFTKDVARRAMLSVYLGQESALSWDDIIIRLFIICGGDNEKKVIDFFAKLKKKPDLENALSEQLISLTGQSYQANTNERIKKVAESLKYNAITEQLPLISADDYKAYKITSQPTIEKINRLLERASQMTRLEKPFTTALIKLSKDIREEEIIKWYGWDANYHYVSDELCWPIIAQLAESQIEADPVRANSHLRSLRQKMSAESAVLPAIDFLSQLAFYYEKDKAIGSLVLNTPDDYIRFYTERFYQIDQYYRLSVEKYYQLKLSEIPIVAKINKAKDRLDQEYSKKCNLLNLEWVKCLKEQGRGLKSVTNTYRQENFYQDHVADKTYKMAIIVSDALRYEVAKELMDEMGKEKHSETLEVGLAMLPTETKFCKPALFPHEEMKMDEAEMMLDGEKCPVSMAQRTAYLNKYKEGAICLDFNEVYSSPMKNREYFKKPLVYIFHNAIDESGHLNDPAAVVDACRSSISKLRDFIQRIHATYNIHNVILTADHGFLFEDKEFAEKDKHPVKEDCIEKKTRYYLTRRDDQQEGITKFKLTDVSGLQDHTMFVAVPDGTNRMAAPGGYQFAHGGASLQELVIPVLFSRLKREDKKEKVGVSVLEANLRMTSSRLKFTVIQSEAISEEMMGRTVQCAVFVGNEQVTAWKDVTLESADEENVNNRLTQVELMLNVQTDANLMELRIYDKDDESRLNPLVKKAVINKTLIEQDF